MKEASVNAPSDVEGVPTGRGLTQFRREQEKKRQEEEKEHQELINKSQQRSQQEKDEAIKFLFDRD
jgi:hypothetical protein